MRSRMTTTAMVSHVAGLIGGSGRASKGRYEGMAPEWRFVILKILDHRGNGGSRMS